jgi:hypothetical protein
VKGRKTQVLGADNTAEGDDTTVAGVNNKTKGRKTQVLGADNTAEGDDVTIAGSGNSVAGAGSCAFGRGHKVKGQGSCAIGDPNVINGDGSFAFGNDNIINEADVAGNGDGVQVVGSSNVVASAGDASGSSIVGNNNVVNAPNAVVVGNASTVTGANGVAIGQGASASGANSAAFGAGATATRDNQQAFGTASSTYTMAGITSNASKQAQGKPTAIVTSNANGDLAAYKPSELGLASTGQIAGLQSQINALGSRDRELTEGIAVSTALAQPILEPGQRFAMTAAWGGFDDANAVGFTAAGVLGRNLLRPGSGTLALFGGVGVGANEGMVAGRAGVSFGW